MANFSHPNILKLGKSKLDVYVRQTCSTEYHPPCPCPSLCSSSPLHITFSTHSKHRFWDPRHVSLSSSSSNSSALIAEHEQVVGKKTICQDGSLFFDLQEKANSRVAVKTALRSLKVKKSRHGRIIKDVMAFGRRYNKASSIEKKVLKGLAVTITVEQSFIGDRDAIHEVMKKSWEESKSQARGDGDVLLVH